MFDCLKRLFSSGIKADKPAVGKKMLRIKPGHSVTEHRQSGKETGWSGKDSRQSVSEPGMITRTCRICGKSFTLPENVQHWPDCCIECRAKYQPVESVTRKCRGCGKNFTFPSNLQRWPKYCRECRLKREKIPMRMV